MTGSGKSPRQLFNILQGDRVITMMGYLSDVEAGGHTVFPNVGAFVKPQKGTMVLWWHMDKVRSRGISA